MCSSNVRIEIDPEFTSRPTTDKILLHAFPNDKNLKDKWLCAIKRVDIDNFGVKHYYLPTELSRICSLHFLKQYYVYES